MDMTVEMNVAYVKERIRALSLGKEVVWCIFFFFFKFEIYPYAKIVPKIIACCLFIVNIQ